MRRSLLSLLAAAGLLRPAYAAPSEIGPARLGTYAAGGLGLYAPRDVWEKDAERARKLGVGIVRFNADAWDVLEPQKGRYQWGALDTAVEVLKKNGIEALFTLPISSKWNGDGKTIKVHGFDVGPTHFPTKDLPGYRAFAKAVAARYKGKIKYYEVWNEQDFLLFWKGKPDAAEYLALIREAYAGLKEGNPQAVVLMGGLAMPKSTEWFDKFLELGGGKFFDVANLHVYPAFATLQEALSVNREVMRRHAVAKPIWITETSTTGLYFETKDREKEEAAKAVFLVKNFAAALSQRDVERVFWHTLRNPGKDVGFPRDMDFGLMAGDGSPLPAHRAFDVFNAELAKAVPEGEIPGEAGIEGYRFKKGGRTIEVVWSRKGEAKRKLPKGRKATRVTIFGESSAATPGADGTVPVGVEPTYLEFDP